MPYRKVVVYYAWSHQAEASAPLDIIENRFPTLFESRRMQFPRLAELRDAQQFEQGIGGFIRHILRRNFERFVQQAREEHGCDVIEQVREDGTVPVQPLDSTLLEEADTLIVISFDSIRTGQAASAAEIAAVKDFLSHGGRWVFVCPHHDIGDTAEHCGAELARQLTEFLHHGDKTIPPQQRFGGFARSLLAGLGAPVRNRFGLRPAALADGSPAPAIIDAAVDRHGLLQGVPHFNLHAHLPHLERVAEAKDSLDVLARQSISADAPAHPFTVDGRGDFDALLQSRADVFEGTLFVCDATLWSSTAGGVDALSRLWRNVFSRAR